MNSDSKYVLMVKKNDAGSYAKLVVTKPSAGYSNAIRYGYAQSAFYYTQTALKLMKEQLVKEGKQKCQLKL